MTPRRRSMLIQMSAAACAGLAAGTTRAQDYPRRTIKILVITPVGGGTDFAARTIAKQLEEALGVSVIVENKPGASGIIASDLVAKSPADGYTMLFTGPLLVQVAGLFKKLPFDPLKDFIPLTDVIRTPLWFAVNTSRVPVRTLKEFSELARGGSRNDTYASIGSGSSLHLFGFGLNEAANLNMMHVPYKGGAPAMVALVSGEVSSVFMDYATLKPYVADGKLRLLAVTGTQRSPLTPDVPTLAELGYAGFESYGWGALFLPANTPPQIVARLYSEAEKALRKPDVVASLKNMGFEVGGTPQAEFAAQVVRDHGKWTELIRRSKVTLD
ncbi:MAG: Bug family tripartite tricarboxylate transporter substrate binding protein [Burkholderiaceae bacterium]